MAQAEEQIRVLIIDDIAETRENLRKLLSFEPDVDVVGVAASGKEGIELSEQYDPHVVLMDINMPGMDGITATEKLLQRVPSAQVVMLSVQGETDYLRRAMLAGARDYLTKPASGDELMGTIRRVYEMAKSRAPRPKPEEPAAPAAPAEEERRGREGDIIAVFSPKGGTGCTTIAVNLAIALQQLVDADQKVALMDADLQFGDVGVMLNLRSERSVADLAHRIDDLDGDMLSGVMTAHGSGIKVLLGPPSPEAAESLRAGGTAGEGGSGLEKILSLLRDDFDFIVVDMWSWIDDVALTLFDVASLIVLVTMPDIPSIKSARLFLEVVRQLDYPLEMVDLVVNGVGRRGAIPVGQIEKAMIPVAAQISFNERAGLTAANRGVPFVVRDRDRTISQEIIEFAGNVRDELSEMEEQEIEEVQQERAETEGVGGTGLLRLKKAFERG